METPLQLLHPPVRGAARMAGSRVVAVAAARTAGRRGAVAAAQSAGHSGWWTHAPCRLPRRRARRVACCQGREADWFSQPSTLCTIFCNLLAPCRSSSAAAALRASADLLDSVLAPDEFLHMLLELMKERCLGEGVC